MANERAPLDPLPVDFVPEGSVATHRVTDGEDWASVAAQYNVKVPDLIYFNFHTNDPEEVNWYLRRNTGCNVSNDGDQNWAFSSSADPGLIYIPPSEVIDMEREEIIAEKPIMQRLKEIGETITGREGRRIRKMLDIVVGQDRPAALWYYNPAAVSYYINLLTTNEERREMTKHTNGQVPFDGDVGLFRQTSEREWRIYPFSQLVVLDTMNRQSDSFLKLSLEGTENGIYKSWEEMANLEGRFEMGGGSALGPLVEEFIKHVYALSQDPSHIYYIYAHDE
jgi:hypothetical protein